MFYLKPFQAPTTHTLPWVEATIPWDNSEMEEISATTIQDWWRTMKPKFPPSDVPIIFIRFSV